ncbi:MAG: hypothetical protein NVSMB44_09880 [Ktedonobacteraceae bacterium]
MIERLKAAYVNNNQVKLAALAGLLLCAVIFAVLSGGFPPWAWRFLFFSVLPNLSRLAAEQGGAVFLPLLGLFLLSLSLLIIWCVIVTLMIKVAIGWWQEHRERQNFNADLREAEQLAEQNLASNALDRWFEDETSALQQQDVPLVHISRATGAGATNTVVTKATHATHTTQFTHAAQSTPASMPLEREYASATRAARVSNGGPFFPETPTPVTNPTFMSPMSPMSPAAPTPAVHEHPLPWVQQEAWHAVDQNNGQSSQDRAYDPGNPPSLPPSGLPASAKRKQLRIVPPPPIEEIAHTDSGQAIDKAFSELLERSSARHSAQIDQPAQSHQPAASMSARQFVQPTVSRYPSWLAPDAGGEIEEVEEVAEMEEEVQEVDVSWLLAGPTNSNSTSPAPSILQTNGSDAVPSVDAGSSIDVSHDMYNTIPFDEYKLAEVRVQPEPGNVPRLIVSIGLDPGIKRRDAPNEDSIFAIQGERVTDNGSMPAGLFVVADGMGGHANGREASRMAIHSISDTIVPSLLRDVSGRDAAEEETIFQDMLKDGVHRANLSIYRRNRETVPEMMGTTLTAALIANSTAYIGNVGDSRTYLYRPSEGLRQITRDHSEVARLVESGAITPEEIYTHPNRNRIYRCLGERASVDMDTFTEPLQPGDVLILCSDGLWEMVREPALEKLIAASAHNPTQLSAILVQAALNHGGADNISVVVVGFLQTEV